MSRIQVLTLSLSDLPISRFFNRFNLNQKWDMWLEILVPSLQSPTLFQLNLPPFLPIPSFPYRHSSPLPTSFSISHPRFTFSPPLPLYDILSSIPPSFRFVFLPIHFFFPSPSFFRILVLLLPFSIVAQPFLIPFSIFFSSRICKLLFPFASFFISQPFLSFPSCILDVFSTSFSSFF